MLKQKKDGFSIIELMVVVTIVAILMTIAVPNYRYYIARTKLIAILNEMESYKARVEAFVVLNSVMPTNVSDVGFATITDPNISTYYFGNSISGIQSIVLDAILNTNS